MTASTAPRTTIHESHSDNQDGILIVDDDPLVLKALQLTLSHEGYNVNAASTPFEALELLKTHSFAIFICDLGLPEMRGGILLQEAERLCPDTIRIALTGNSDIAAASEAINIGHVSHFLMKPWDTTTLIQIVINSLEKFRLVQENRQLQQTIFQQHTELEKTHELLRYDLKLGARIHEELLLGKPPEGLSKIDVAAATIPSREIDGDFIEFFHPTPDYFDLAVGDVMGKGIPAALVGIALKIELQRFAIPFSKSVFCENGQPWQYDLLSPSQIVGQTDKAITAQLLNLDYFATLFYGRFDFTKQTFTFVDCGSQKPIHYSKVIGDCKLLSCNNFPIGVVIGHTYEQCEVRWHPGDLFIFYSDGVTESLSPSGEMFGFDRLCDIIQKGSDLSAAALLSRIKTAVLAFSEKASFDDDVTIVVVRTLNSPTERQTVFLEERMDSDLELLPRTREFVTRLCSNAQGNIEKLTKDLHLAINEAFCNIVKHGYANKKGGEIVMRGACLENGVLIDLYDKGINFNPLSVPRPEMPCTKECGYGLYIMGQIVDKLIYWPKQDDNEWNKLRMYKSYSKDAVADQAAWRG